MNHERLDGYNLDRFVAAQEAVYPVAIAELRSGRKRSHWMWFIFPQIAGLGSSPTAQHYAIHDREEARAYLEHTVLGPRLIECTETVLALTGVTAADVFGHPDDLKLRSSATLFAEISQPRSVFDRLLAKYYDGVRDPLTLERLAQSGGTVR
jgi:uncharacterized protein (DUF1810 family)